MKSSRSAYRNGEQDCGQLNSIAGLTLLQESRQFSSHQQAGEKLQRFLSLSLSCSISWRTWSLKCLNHHNVIRLDRHQQSHMMLKMASFLTEVPEWTQPPKPPQDGTDLIYYKSIVICLFGLFQETIQICRKSGNWKRQLAWNGGTCHHPTHGTHELQCDHAACRMSWCIQIPS